MNELNHALTTAYRAISKVEEHSLRRMSEDLSLSEIHMLESIGALQERGATVTDIAQELDITPPSVTVMVKRLEAKGYITKDRSAEDGRRVQIVLSAKGRRAEYAHRYFHRKMVRSITRDLTQAECDAILSGLNKINAFMMTSAADFDCGKEDDL